MNTAEYIYFELNGFTYRTVDGSKVEGKDGATWNVTNSLKVHFAAKEACKAAR